MAHDWVSKPEFQSLSSNNFHSFTVPAINFYALFIYILWPYQMLHFVLISSWLNQIWEKKTIVCVKLYTNLSAGRHRHSVHIHFGPHKIEILWPTTIFCSICLRADRLIRTLLSDPLLTSCALSELVWYPIFEETRKV